MVKRLAIGLVAFTASCSSTPSLMVQTVSGNYLDIAKCVHRQMYREMDRMAWIPQLMDFDDEGVAEIRTTANTTFATTTAINQRFEQHGDQVKMIFEVPASLNMGNDKAKMQARWDACVDKQELQQ